MLRPYLHTCGCPSPLPAGSALQCKKHAWDFTHARITASNNRYGTAIRHIDSTLTRKRGDLQRLRDDVSENRDQGSEEWMKEIRALEKEVGYLEEAREEALGLMRSYEVLAKGEYGYGVWKEAGP